MSLLPVLATAFFAGLLGGGHCLGMCGGIAGGMGALSSGRWALGHALFFNAGRILSYALIGALAAGLLGATMSAVDLPGWTRLLRAITALLIALVGLRFLFDWQGLVSIERAGAGLWARISPLARRAITFPGGLGRFMLGMVWGFLPCGLVYTMLLTASSTGSFADGFITMLAFGLGTLPTLLGLTLWAPALAGLLQDRFFRRVIGAALLLLAAWSLMLVLGVGAESNGHASH